MTYEQGKRLLIRHILIKDSQNISIIEFYAVKILPYFLSRFILINKFPENEVQTVDLFEML